MHRSSSLLHARSWLLTLCLCVLPGGLALSGCATSSSGGKARKSGKKWQKGDNWRSTMRRAEEAKLYAASIPGKLAPGAMRAHFINVGQGDATLLEWSCGAVLVDAGGENNFRYDAKKAIDRYLIAFFRNRPDLKRRIDSFMLTHPHIDHARGVPVLLSRYKLGNVVDNGRPGDPNICNEANELQDWVKEQKNVDAGVGYRGIALADLPGPQQALTGPIIDPINCGDIDPKISVLWGAVASDPGWGTSRYGHSHFENENNHSVVIRVDHGKSSIMLTGDLEEHAIHTLVARFQGSGLLDVDLYQAGHHGSHNGTTPGLMKAMSPELSIISMGDPAREIQWTAWTYGHPRLDAVRMLVDGTLGQRNPASVLVARRVKRFFEMSVDKAVYGTAWDGHIIVEMTPEGQRQVLLSAPAKATSGG